MSVHIKAAKQYTQKQPLMRDAMTIKEALLHTYISIQINWVAKLNSENIQYMQT